MNEKKYCAYAEAIKGLLQLPEELQQHQERCLSATNEKRRKIEKATSDQIKALEQIENLAYQQFDEVAYEYKSLFFTPVSRPDFVPCSLSPDGALQAQNKLAQSLNGIFANLKQSAVDKRRQQIEAEKAEYLRQAALKAAEEEKRRKLLDEEQRRLEEEYERQYRKQLDRANGFTFSRLINFFKGH